MTLVLITISVLFSILLLLIAEYSRLRQLRYFFKPLTLLLIFAIVWLAPHPVSAHYRQFILIGLGFSLFGDAFLLFPNRWFLPGLFSFLITHICYITAFTEDLSGDVSLLLIVILSTSAILFTGATWKHLGPVRVPVIVYAVILLVMVGSSAERYIQVSSPGALSGLLGAILFLISDGMLAVNRFIKPFRAAQAVILSTYFIAQWLIALSVRG
ncbi:MAG: lysoplasmalogenase [Fidelibacterota bacterium]